MLKCKFLKMDKEIDNNDYEWQQKLPLVLDLVKKNPDSIVDDTSVEKLLSWLAETADDEKERNKLIHPATKLLVFLSSPIDCLLSNPSCANFSLRLAGILAGCDETVCTMLIDNGCLQNLFATFGSYDNTYFGNAIVKCAFFEGFSSIVSNFVGFLWSANLPGLIEYAIGAFSNSSFYVVKSAISFLKDILLAADSHGANQKIRKIKKEILGVISKENLSCNLEKKSYYLDLVYLMFDFNPALAWELLDALGGITSFLLDINCKPLKLLQSTSEVCHQIIEKGRTNTYVISSERMEHHNNIFGEILKVSVQVAKIDVIHLFRHLSCIIFSAELSVPQNVPEYWNASIIILILGSILRKQNGNARSPLPVDENIIPTINKNTMPEDFVSSFNELDSIIKDKLNDKVIWKKCLVIVMDTCKGFFAKNQRETLGSQGKYFVQFWVLFLCEILEVVSKDKEMMPPDCGDEFLSCLIGHKYLTSKCITIERYILKNGWFKEFSTGAKKKIITSLIQILDEPTTNTQTLSSSIQLFGSLIEVLDDELSKSLFANINTLDPELLKHDERFPLVEMFQSSCNKLPGLFAKLLADTHWEVKDSVLELISFMVTKSKESIGILESPMLEEFLKREQFWLKSWTLSDADEAYVRSASIRVICLAYENRNLREILLSKQSLENVLSKLSSVFETDDEAFPKRSIIDAIHRWLDLEELVYFIKENEVFTENDKPDNDEGKISSFIFNVLNKAHTNLDWEVKMKGILCWEKILKIGHAKGSKLESNVEITSQRNRCLNIFCRRKGSSILIEAINDCDKLVCESAFNTLQWIQSNYIEASSNKIKPDITSTQDFIDIHGIDFASIDQFLTFLNHIDFGQVAESIKLTDEKVINNPISLLNDIIAAAEINDDNLLDCY